MKLRDKLGMVMDKRKREEMKLRNKQQILDFKEMKKLVANDVAFISSRDLSFLSLRLGEDHQKMMRANKKNWVDEITCAHTNQIIATFGVKPIASE
jgi:hypothetical protein